MDLAKTGRLIVAMAFIAFGIEHFIFGDFIIGRAPAWPDNMPGRLVWAFVSGIIMIVTGIGIISQTKARLLAVAAGIMIFLWAFLRQVPVILSDPTFGGRWTMAFKALMLCGGAFVVAGSLPKEESGNTRFLGTALENNLLPIGQTFIGLFFILCGIQHFMFLEFVQTLVPGWIPGHIFWTYFAGVALIAGGAGLVFRIKAKLAALLSGIMVLIWTFVLHAPRAVSMNNSNEWIAVFEALAVSGIMFIIAGTLKK